MLGLTNQSRPRDPDAFPAVQLFLLALVRVAEPIALTSLFPYAVKLAAHYGTPESQAPFFAGLLISAFSMAEACTGMHWGGLSDRIGRKPVLLMGILGTISSLLIVGFAPNFWVAFAGRLIGGALNGNIGVIQTMVGELVKNPVHEPKAYSVMPFVWSIGTIVGPSIGGYFAEPVQNFPMYFSSTGVFAKFPYLLPNLLCILLLVIAVVAGHVLLEETHPDMQPWSTQADLDTTSARTPLLPTQGAVANAAANLDTECYGTFDTVDVQHTESWRVSSRGDWIEDRSSHTKAITGGVLTFVIALGIFTYHSMTYDHLLPIFLQDKRTDDTVIAFKESSGSLAGGLGIPLQGVGIIMSVNGLIQLFIQAVVFPLLASWVGCWRLLVLVTIFHPVAYLIVPLLPLLPPSLLDLGIYTCLAIRSLASIIAYPLLLIMIKEAAPSPTHLGRINGLAASTGAACRTVASPVAGLLYGISINMRFTPLAWWVSALVALVGVFQIPLMTRAVKTLNVKIGPAGDYRTTGQFEQTKKLVHITVEEDDDEELEPSD